MTILGVFTSAAFDESNPAGVKTAPSASVEVRRETDNALAAIWSDQAGTINPGNPFNADTLGRFQLYALAIPDVGYKITVTFGGNSYIMRHVPIGTAQYRDLDQDVKSSSTPAFAQVALGADPATPTQAATKSYVDALQLAVVLHSLLGPI